MSFWDDVYKAASVVMNPLTVAVVHPLQTIEAVFDPNVTVQDVINEHFSQPLKTQLLETAGSVAAEAATVLTFGTETGIAALGTIGKALIPASTIGKVVAAGGLALAAPIVAGQIISHPKETAKLVENLPKNAIAAETDLFNLSKTPTLEGAKEFLDSHPYLTASTAIVALLTAGFTIGGLTSFVQNYYNNKTVQANTKVGQEQLKQSLNSNPISDIKENKNTGQPPTQPIQIINQLPPTTPPIVPVTPPISGVVSNKTTTKKKKKATKNKKRVTKKKKTYKKKKVYKKKKHKK
jgi:hypothetical protein